MCQNPATFTELASELHRLHDAREAVIDQALGALEACHPPLAQLLLSCTGDRHRAARWLVMPQRAFSGRNAYDMLADGDVDGVWEQVVLKQLGVAPAL
ncbi:MAG TPA: DUF2384 domain-containing protein [Luteibacter sp.]|jgi:hypothetical protein|nr:DUF2384 domain-containing protein [Luteibacter sp.]